MTRMWMTHLSQKIAQQYRDNREEYNRIVRMYTKRYAAGIQPELSPIDPDSPWWEGMTVAIT